MKTLMMLGVLSIMFILAGCYPNELGSRWNDQRFNLVSKEIDRVQGELSDLENRASVEPDSLNKLALGEEVVVKSNQLTYLLAARDSILLGAINNSGLPKEITKKEERARVRVYYLRRQEMVNKKIENNLSSNGLGASGYKVIFKNNHYTEIVFRVYPINGGETTAVYLEPRERRDIALIPGSYLVHTYARGVEVCKPETLTIDGRIVYFQQEECYGFACY